MPEDRLKKILSVFEEEKGALIPILQRVQEEFGYLPEETLARIAWFLKIPLSQVFSVATFYAQFYLTRRGDHLVRVCQGTACHVRGGKTILKLVKQRLDVDEGQTTPDLEYTLETLACIGVCALAPNIVVGDRVYGHMNPKKVEQLFKKGGE